MSGESKIQDTAEAIKGIVQAVPVYQDIMQPAAKEVGTALQTVAKTIHIALAPVSALVWGYEKIKDFLDETLTKKLQDIPKERIVSPNPSVAGPTIEALRFHAHEPDLREIYANLLAKSMDSLTSGNAHPAFVEIIRQMAPDEARIVEYMAGNFGNPIPAISGFVIRETKLANFAQVVGKVARHFTLLRYRAGCKRPELIESYLDNLIRLGIIEIVSYESLYPDSITNPDVGPVMSFHAVEKHFDFSESKWLLSNDATSVSGIKREFIRLTSFGHQFCDVCLYEAREESRLEELADLAPLYQDLLKDELSSPEQPNKPKKGKERRIRNSRT